jgi:Cu(I)/Ag(I) efflux system membrane fusion protein
MKNSKSIILGVAFAIVAALTLSVTSVSAESGTQAFDKAMQPILKSYLEIHKALAGDSTKGVKTAAKSIAGKAGKLDAKSVTGEHREHYQDIPAKLKKAATTLSKASSLEQAREAFKDLSKPMAMWGTMSKPASIDVVFCSMAKGSWLQKSGTVLNPYHGKSMLHCGEVVGGAGHAMKSAGHESHGGKKHHGGH